MVVELKNYIRELSEEAEKKSKVQAEIDKARDETIMASLTGKIQEVANEIISMRLPGVLETLHDETKQKELKEGVQRTRELDRKEAAIIAHAQRSLSDSGFKRFCRNSHIKVKDARNRAELYRLFEKSIERGIESGIDFHYFYDSKYRDYICPSPIYDEDGERINEMSLVPGVFFCIGGINVKRIMCSASISFLNDAERNERTEAVQEQFERYKAEVETNKGLFLKNEQKGYRQK